MLSLRHPITVVLIVMASLTSSIASADEVLQKTLTFSMREDPADPESEISLLIELDIVAVATDGNWVGWEVRTLRFTRPNTDILQEQWTTEMPPIDTEDGLWWVEHAEPAVPQTEEFATLPAMVGFAQAVDPDEPDIEYSLETSEYTPPEDEESITDVIARIKLYLQKLDEMEPVEEEEDKPAEVFIDDDPPIGS